VAIHPTVGDEAIGNELHPTLVLSTDTT